MKRCELCNTKLIKVGEGGLWACPKHPEFMQGRKKPFLLKLER